MLGAPQLLAPPGTGAAASTRKAAGRGGDWADPLVHRLHLCSCPSQAPARPPSRMPSGLSAACHVQQPLPSRPRGPAAAPAPTPVPGGSRARKLQGLAGVQPLWALPGSEWAHPAPTPQAAAGWTPWSWLSAAPASCDSARASRAGTGNPDARRTHRPPRSAARPPRPPSTTETCAREQGCGGQGLSPGLLPAGGPQDPGCHRDQHGGGSPCVGGGGRHQGGLATGTSDQEAGLLHPEGARARICTLS